MKKIIIKVGIIIMALVSMINMNACSKLNSETANEVCSALADKYGETFVAVKIGDRFNTDHAKLYVHPENDEKLIFVAEIDRDTKLVEDDYIVQKVNREVDKFINRCSTEQGLTVSSNCCVITREPLQVVSGDWTPETFWQEYSFDFYFVYLLVNAEGVDIEKLYSVMEKSGIELNVDIRFKVYVFDGNNYQKCIEDIQLEPDANTTIIEKHNPISSCWNDVTNGSCSITKEELKEALREE